MKKRYLLGIMLSLGLATLAAGQTHATPVNTSFTDDNFYACVLKSYSSSTTRATNLTDAQLASITSLSCAASDVSDATGIEKLTNVSTINLSGNKLTSLNVTKNRRLKILNASSNYLTSIDLSENILLERLDLSNNRLSAAPDLSNNPLLSEANTNLSDNLYNGDGNTTDPSTVTAADDDDTDATTDTNTDTEEDEGVVGTDVVPNTSAYVAPETETTTVTTTTVVTETPDTGIFGGGDDAGLIFIIPSTLVGVLIALFVARYLGIRVISRSAVRFDRK